MHNRYKFENFNDKSQIVAFKLAIIGLLLVIVGFNFQCEFMKIDVDSTVSNVGSLLLFVGVFQWLFEKYAKEAFFREVREEIVGNTRVAGSGIADYHSDSKDVDFDEIFVSSQKVIIGINYSAKLIDNSLSLLQERCKRGLNTTIVVVDPASKAGQFLEVDFDNPQAKHGPAKIESIVKGLNSKSTHVTIVKVQTVLKYSFILFDDRIWIIIGTNGLGRRAVPGFFVRRNTTWFQHFENDILLLQGRV